MNCHRNSISGRGSDTFRLPTAARPCLTPTRRCRTLTGEHVRPHKISGSFTFQCSAGCDYNEQAACWNRSPTKTNDILLGAKRVVILQSASFLNKGFSESVAAGGAIPGVIYHISQSSTESCKRSPTTPFIYLGDLSHVIRIISHASSQSADERLWRPSDNSRRWHTWVWMNQSQIGKTITTTES